uniref:Uncharacterized protein n=1 Tax=Branchiostoma floridae TaxID=7739 RepID=C3Z2M3_BRAFL|eukprot:XP_002597262.1 hypothetical protein BRAFLDRAFT_66397 [Branchiostoma floridae]
MDAPCHAFLHWMIDVGAATACTRPVQLSLHYDKSTTDSAVSIVPRAHLSINKRQHWCLVVNQCVDITIKRLTSLISHRSEEKKPIDRQAGTGTEMEEEKDVTSEVVYRQIVPMSAEAFWNATFKDNNAMMANMEIFEDMRITKGKRLTSS